MSLGLYSFAYRAIIAPLTKVATVAGDTDKCVQIRRLTTAAKK